MNLKRFILVFGVVIFVVVVGVFGGCEQNHPTAPGEKISSRMRAETCEKYGTISVSGGEYTIQNCVWGADTRQCVETTSGTGFRVSVSEHNQGSVAGYPSVFKGCHWGDCTNNSGMPVRVRDVSSAPFSFSVSSYRPSGDYNVAAEAWLSPNQSSDDGYNGGAEVMIVLDVRNMGYSGSQVGTFMGHDVYFAEIGWNFVTYVSTGRSSASGDMMDFINDAISRGYVDPSWYLHVMEAGFEIMSGGQGLECNSFSFSVSGGGGGTTTTTSGGYTTTTTSGGGGSNSIVVRARGTNGSEHINLTVGGSQIGSWTLSTSMSNYTISTNNTGDINVCFDNDGSDRDVQVDYIEVNGQRRQAEDQSYNTGVWQDGSCGGEYSEWLHCNGCIDFGDVSGGGGTTTTTAASTSTTTTSGGGGSNSIIVRAHGTNGSEHINLTVGGSQIGSWTLSTSMSNYTVSTNNTGDINVCFDNDGSDRDVQVDYIEVNGQRRQAEDQSYNTGVWQDGSCGGEYSEWLHCNGCIDFGDVSGGGGTTTTTAASTSTTTTSATTTTTSGGGGETCSPVDASISAPFTQNGAGEYCWTATSCNYINSWNLSSLTINGENFTNKWASSSNLPAKINGNWYIHYEGNYNWSHFELR